MNPTRLTVQQIAERIGATVQGDPRTAITGPGSIEQATGTQITFASDARRIDQLAASNAAAAIVQAETPRVEGMVLLRVEDVEMAWSALLEMFAPDRPGPVSGIDPAASVDPAAEIDPTASVAPGAVIQARVRIGAAAVISAGCVLETDCQVGENSRLGPGVVVRHGCRIGRGCQIGPNSVIGHDGFGYIFRDGDHRKVPHIGDVVIEDDVELGACVCVDRAKFGSTRIGAGTKVDNLVQIAHNVQIGPGCLLVGQCGIAGSARLGAYVVLGGNAGVRDHVQLGDQARLAAYSAAATDIPPGQSWAGTPAGQSKQQFRQIMALGKLPDLLKQVRKLESRVQALESTEDD
jgi:UDP-3-O-[3-hydroxymyristoyl] glucosamine N-acyltransferase